MAHCCTPQRPFPVMSRTITKGCSVQPAQCDPNPNLHVHVRLLLHNGRSIHPEEGNTNTRHSSLECSIAARGQRKA